ncbi:hypothetical protein VZT92_023030 [Zoarces viviparus]|uniref:Uncharacterized protein n=1 Tax=Zoarces viviparus TaxID=48416 RepID=A0AAW1E501_ZOAVI
MSSYSEYVDEVMRLVLEEAFEDPTPSVEELKTRTCGPSERPSEEEVLPPRVPLQSRSSLKTITGRDEDPHVLKRSS